MRTDIHAPKSIDPKEYRYLGPYCKDPDVLDKEYNQKIRTFIDRFGVDGNFKNKGTCDHCGSYFVYGAVYQHTNSETIVVGWICSEETLEVPDRAKLDHKRMVQAAATRRERLRLEACAKKFLAEHVGLEEVLEADHSISRDLKHKLYQYGSLSDKQVELAHKLYEQVNTVVPVVVEIKVPCPSGRMLVTGTILGIKCQESMYGLVVKMLVRDDRGFKVYGTLPQALGACAKGSRIEFTGTLQPSKADECFGFFSRPTGARELTGD